MDGGIEESAPRIVILWDLLKVSNNEIRSLIAASERYLKLIVSFIETFAAVGTDGDVSTDRHRDDRHAGGFALRARELD